MSTDAATNKPFHVRTDTNVFRSGHDTPEGAASACVEANAAAESLGIQTRYVATPKP